VALHAINNSALFFVDLFARGAAGKSSDELPPLWQCVAVGMVGLVLATVVVRSLAASFARRREEANAGTMAF
jgi:hypothetical protein